MPGGINHAKKIVIDEAACLADKLQNGKSDCIETQGKAIALIVKMLTPLYEAEFVTVEQCQNTRESLKKENSGNDELTELAVGPMHIKGKINVAYLLIFLCLAGVVFAIGKSESWW